MGTNTSGQHITLLLGAYGTAGLAYLPDQLASLKAQSHEAWSLIVSDDSAPELEALVGDFAADVSQAVTYQAGPGQGFAANFMAMLRNAPAGYLAFADQDDIWREDKLARAVATLKGVEGPALYTGRVTYWEGDTKRPEPPWPRQPSFENALIENVARGNTIVMNPQAAALMRDAAASVGRVFAHDWLCYLVVSGAGGSIICDPGAPVLDYRQHGDTQIGAGTGAKAQVARKRAVLRGAFRARLDDNVAALEACADLLTPQNRDTLHRFAQARRAGWAGLPTLARLGLYRQRPQGTLGFWGATLLGRA
ncbi:MAG: glycosyltransferase [Rhodobacteraceae bacterium]|nr:glycosyltransferase [Paracoccaceae bacterium]